MKKHVIYALVGAVIVVGGAISVTLISRTRAANTIGFVPAALRESVFGTDSKFSAYTFSPVPVADITFTFSTNKQCEVNVGSWRTTGTFPAFQGQSKAYISVRAVDDNSIQGTHNCAISYTTSSSDSNYNGLSGSSTIPVTDNDAVPKLYYDEKPASVREDGSLHFAFHPTDDPTDNVYVTTSISGPCVLRTGPLTGTKFTTYFYPGPPAGISYSIVPTNDAVYRAGQTCTVSNTPASTKDPNYNGKRLADFTVTVIDNDAAGAADGGGSSSTGGSSTSAPTKTRATLSVNPKKPAAKSLSDLKADGTPITAGGQAGQSFAANTPITFSGKTIPHGIVTLYVYSTPRQYVAHADAKGTWTYEVPPLPSGSHHAEVTVTDPATKQTSKRSQLLAFTVAAPPIVPSSEARDSSNKVWIIWLLITAGALSLLSFALWRWPKLRIFVRKKLEISIARVVRKR